MATLYEIKLPVAVPNNVTLPPVGNPTFAGLALKYVNHWVNVWVPAFNDLNQVVYNNAKAAEERAQAAGDALNAALAAATAAKQAQFASEQVSGAKPWVPGGTYAVDEMRWGTEGSAGQLFRCTVPVSGSNTPPQDDAAHWKFVGATTSVDPTSGPTSQVMVYDANGEFTQEQFMLNGRAGAITITCNAAGDPVKVVTDYQGLTRTEVVEYNADGTIKRVTATVV